MINQYLSPSMLSMEHHFNSARVSKVNQEYFKKYIIGIRMFDFFIIDFLDLMNNCKC